MKCPSCGMEIPDDSEICPYCTARVHKRIRIKTIYIVALALLVVAASYATLAFVASEVEISKIADLGLNDNYNFVHVRGTVVDYPRTYDTSYGVEQLSFRISDGTDTLLVKIYRDLVDRVVEENKVPGIGDEVDVQGTFTYGTSKGLIVNNVEFLRVSRVKFSEVPLSEIASASPWDFKNGDAVSVVANITGVREYSFGYIATMDDSLDVLIPRAYTSLSLLNLAELGSGVVRVDGTLQFYEPIKPSSDYVEVNMSEVMSNPGEFNNTNILVRWATVVSKDADSRTLVVNANGTNITVYSSRGVDYYDPGDHVEIQGKFTYYGGAWEISVTRKNDFITEPRWEVIMHPSYGVVEKKNYVENGTMDLYSFVEIRGIVADYRELSSGYLLTLWNGSSSYSVYVENKKSIAGNINYGSEVLVRGIVTLYRGDKEVKVRAYTHDSVEVVG